jgi:hypothetical protein
MGVYGFCMRSKGREHLLRFGRSRALRWLVVSRGKEFSACCPQQSVDAYVRWRERNLVEQAKPICLIRGNVAWILGFEVTGHSLCIGLPVTLWSNWPPVP